MGKAAFLILALQHPDNPALPYLLESDIGLGSK